MLYDVYKRKFDNITEDSPYSNTQLIAVFFISIGTGIVSAFFGVGGGIITVPVLIYLLGIYPRRAIGTSAFMILLTSTVGFVCYYLLSLDILTLPGVSLRSVPYIHFDTAIILGIIVFIGAYLGSSWGLRSLKTRNVQMIFIVIVFFVGVQLLLRVMGYI